MHAAKAIVDVGAALALAVVVQHGDEPVGEKDTIRVDLNGPIVQLGEAVGDHLGPHCHEDVVVKRGLELAAIVARQADVDNVRREPRSHRERRVAVDLELIAAEEARARLVLRRQQHRLPAERHHERPAEQRAGVGVRVHLSPRGDRCRPRRWTPLGRGCADRLRTRLIRRLGLGLRRARGAILARDAGHNALLVVLLRLLVVHQLLQEAHVAQARFVSTLAPGPRAAVRFAFALGIAVRCTNDVLHLEEGLLGRQVNVILAHATVLFVTFNERVHL
mmetsp:Transcript_54801/g.141148  ORF Transcript_54801/g.141148 Transcript_54801/m.141148 type:complete len:277 (+) Transcript_54801:884-1714(+)